MRVLFFANYYIIVFQPLWTIPPPFSCTTTHLFFFRMHNNKIQFFLMVLINNRLRLLSVTFLLPPVLRLLSFFVGSICVRVAVKRRANNLNCNIHTRKNCSPEINVYSSSVRMAARQLAAVSVPPGRFPARVALMLRPSLRDFVCMYV